MFSEKINNLINKNYITILKDIIESDKETFKQDVLRVDEKDNSLFIAFLKLKNEEAFARELLEVLENFNYSLAKKHKSVEKEKGLVKYLVNAEELNDKKISDFLYVLLENNNSKIIDLVVKHVEEKNKEVFVQIEKDGWNLFKVAANRHANGYLSKEGLEIISKYCDPKLLEKEQSTILNILERKEDGIRIFWEAKNGTKIDGIMKKEEFNHYFALLGRQIDRVYNKKSDETQNIIDSVVNKKDRFNEEQKNKILEMSLACTDKRLFKDVLKSFGLKMKDKHVRDIVLSNLEKTDSMDYCYLFLNKEDFFTLTKKGVYGFESISSFISKKYINLDVVSRANRRIEEKYNLAIVDRLKEAFKEDGYGLLYDKREGEKTAFDLYLQKVIKKGVSNLMEIFNVRFDGRGIFNFKSFKKEDIEKENIRNLTQEQKKEVQDFLDATWFKKDEEGKMNIEKASTYKVNSLEVFKSEVLLNCLNEQQDKLLFSFLMNNIKEVYNKDKSAFGFQNYNLAEFFKAKYEEYKADKSFNWEELNIKKEALEKIKDSELYFEIKAILFASRLDKELANKKEVRKSIKI